MSVLNFANAPAAQSSNRGNPFANLEQNQEPREKAKVWMNVGYDVNGKFISLPLGQALDTMKAADIRGQNEDFVKQRSAQNVLLKALQDLGASMAPGQEQTLKLTVKLRRVNEELNIPAAENEYAIDMASLIG